MTNLELLDRFSVEIKSIALFAKRIKFDMNNDISELIRLYVNETKVLYEEENKEQMIKMIKTYL